MRIISAVENAFSSSFCAVAGLHPGGAGDHLGAGRDGHLHVDVHHRRTGMRRDQYGARPVRARGPQRGRDVGGAAARGQADGDVAGPDVGRVGDPAGLVVLHVLDRALERLRAAGMVGDDERRGPGS